MAEAVVSGADLGRHAAAKLKSHDDSRDVKSFLSKKLDEFITSQYKFTTVAMEATNEEERHKNAGCVRLLHSSPDPISMATKSDRPIKSSRKVLVTSDSSDSEEQKVKLKAAVVDARYILTHK